MARRKTEAATSSGDPGTGDSSTRAVAITGNPTGTQIGVRVSPGAPRTQVRGVYGDRLKVAVSAPPEDNRANNELVEALAGWLQVRRDTVRIESGHSSRDKVVSFAGVDEVELRGKLAVLLR